ncbi:MAG TPA: hypothetical protein VG015_03565, partial [Candidatus Dormibacteraeota bacterium]|nr:hypothetical protein [Candidatus Dormibacteraeota bacterium]
MKTSIFRIHRKLFSADVDATGMFGGSVAPSVSKCSAGDCQSQGQWQCAYVDSNHRRCETRWCQSHGTVLNGWVFCRRHATVADAITRAAGTLREVKTVPAVGDRGMGLAVAVGTEISHQMMSLLHSAYGSYPYAQIHGDDMVRAVWQDRHEVASGLDGEQPMVTKTWRELYWEWSWSVSTSAGFLKRVVLSVPAFDPPIVQIKVDRNPVFSGIPDWIEKRL